MVYSFDARDALKQRRADEILRSGLLDGSLVLAHQCIVEFVAAVSRPREELGRAPLLSFTEARLEAEELVTQYPVLYPTREVVLTALRGMATYGLSWFDAHLLAHADFYGVDEILSEDFTHGRHYGTVRAVNPFLSADAVHELPPLYAPTQIEKRSTAAQRSRSHSARTRS